MLACTYGELDLNFNQNLTNKEGYVMFWTLKNPSYPERILKYPSSNYLSIQINQKKL